MYAGGYSDDDSDNDYMFTSFDEIKRSGNLPKEEIVVPVKSNEERLVTAAYDGDLTTIKEIFENDTGFSVNTVLPGSKSALMIAASYSYSHIVEYLLEKGADADQQCDMETPLMCACASISTQIIASVQCVSSILAKKVRVNIGDKYGQTALMKACQSGKVDIVNILLKLSNIDAQDRRGKTAIFYAVTGDHPDVVRVLAEKGALKDPHICSNVKLCMLGKRSPKVAAIISEYIAPDEDEPEESNILSATEKWPDLFPGILSKDKPAFYFDVPLILFGMNCERLIPLFTEKGVSLAKLLCIDEQTLIKLGVTMPYERKKVFKGLRKFHLHKWNMETVLGIAANKRRKFMAETSLTDLGAWFRILTVLESSIYFNNDRITSEVPNPHQNAKLLRAASDNYNNIIDTKKELKKWKRNILRITQKNLPPPDLIVPNNPLSAKSFTKTKITFGVWSAVIITVLYVCIKR